ncbi:MAG: GNAT family N-acetyltransferase [Rhodospirillaceae bacterium]
MADDDIIIREARAADMPRITEIYAHHVATGGGSWEYVGPDEAEMTRRRQAVQDAECPYVVAEASGAILGYAYAAQYRPRPGYRYTVEDSVYVAAGAEGRGVGAKLLTVLIERCEAAGYRQMIAVIGDAENHGSIALHRKMGFRQVGLFENIGFKFGRWLASIIMLRALGPGADTLPRD